MANEAHTRGPWVAVEVGQGGPADNPMPVYEIQSADGHARIAEYVDAKNAPILAAAPLLLEALCELKQFLDMFLAVTGGLPPEANGPAAKALAAIAAATNGAK